MAIAGGLAARFAALPEFRDGLRTVDGDAPAALAALPPCGVRVTFARPPDRATIEAWLTAAEPFAINGGAVVFLAENFPRVSGFTRMLPDRHADTPLRDDAGQRAAHLRQGEWGALHYGGRTREALGAASRIWLRVKAGTRQWDSAVFNPQAWAEAWRCAGGLAAHFPAPWGPGQYSVQLHAEPAASDGGAVATHSLKILPSARHFPPREFAVEWRMLPGTGVRPEPAGVLLGNGPAPARLELGADGRNCLAGWHEPELHEGKWRRWMSAHAEFRIGGRAGRLLLSVADHRPRQPGTPDETRLSVFADGERLAACRLESEGPAEISIPWPAGDATRRVSLLAHPDWTPAAHGSPGDCRRLGLLVYGVELRDA